MGNFINCRKKMPDVNRIGSQFAAFPQKHDLHRLKDKNEVL